MSLPKTFAKTSQVVLARSDGPEFTLLDRKVFNVLYANAYRKMKSNPLEQTRHTINLRDLALAVLQPHDDMRMIRESLERLWSVKISVDFEHDMVPHTLRCHYLSYQMSHMGDGDLVYAFDELLMQFIANQKVFSLIEVDISTAMTSLYGSKLYEIMSMSLRLYRPWNPSIDEFRSLFELGDKHTRPDHLKAHVIDRAIDDVNSNANFTVEVEYKRGGKGGKIIGMSFRAAMKRTEELQLDGRLGKLRNDTRTIDLFEGVPDGDKLIPPDLRSDTMQQVERLMATKEEPEVDVLKLRDQWFAYHGARAHQSPDEKFLAWAKVQKEKRDSESLQDIDLDSFMGGLVK